MIMTDFKEHLLQVVTTNKKTGEKTTYNNVVEFDHFYGNDGRGYCQYFRVLTIKDDGKLDKRIAFKPYDVDVEIKMMWNEESGEE